MRNIQFEEGARTVTRSRVSKYYHNTFKGYLYDGNPSDRKPEIKRLARAVFTGVRAINSAAYNQFF